MLLSYRLPREPSTPRITEWRKLKRLGVVQISDGLVALWTPPPSRATTTSEPDKPKPAGCAPNCAASAAATTSKRSPTPHRARGPRGVVATVRLGHALGESG